MRSAALILSAIIFAACSARVTASSVTYRKEYVLRTPVHVTYVDLNDPSVRVTIGIAKRGRGSSESMSSMVARTRPDAAITGTFFDTHSLLPTGDIVVAGMMVHSGCVGSYLCIGTDNRAKILPRKFASSEPKTDYETLIGGGATLVYDGKIALNPRSEGFSSRGIFGSARRTAAGVTDYNKLLLVSINRPVSLRHLAKIMQALGSKEAMLLDGGSSTAMYTEGRFVTCPARRLTNLILIYKTPDSYLQAAGEFAPTLIPAEKIIERIYQLRYGSGWQLDNTWYARIVKDSMRLSTVSISASAFSNQTPGVSFRRGN